MIQSVGNNHFPSVSVRARWGHSWCVTSPQKCVTGLEQMTWAQMQWACKHRRDRHEDHLTFKAHFGQLHSDIGLCYPWEEIVEENWLGRWHLHTKYSCLFSKYLNSFLKPQLYWFPPKWCFWLFLFPLTKCLLEPLKLSITHTAIYWMILIMSLSFSVLSLFLSLSAQYRSFSYYHFTLWHFLPYISI